MEKDISQPGFPEDSNENLFSQINTLLKENRFFCEDSSQFTHEMAPGVEITMAELGDWLKGGEEAASQ